MKKGNLMGVRAFGPGYGDMAGTFGVHPWVQKITANILNRMIKDSPRR